MKTPGRIFLLTFFCLLLAGAAFGQEEPAEQPTGQTESKEEPAATKSGSRSSRIPFGIRAGYTHWKEVNQAHGHSMGSETLREVSRRIRLKVRRFDKLFRFGGRGNRTHGRRGQVPRR